MDISSTYLWVSLGVQLLVIAIALLLLYMVIRFAIGHGLRDHQVWMNKTGASGPESRP